MSVFRIPKVKNYTVMANHHLRDKRLSNKAKGLLSTMLMLPDNWDYTMKGLTRLSSDGLAAIRAALQELEDCGYLVRRQIRDSKGLFAKTEYVIFEEPQPSCDYPICENPITDNPITDSPSSGNCTQINTKSTSTKEENTDLPNTIPSYPSGKQEAEMILKEMNEYRSLIMENISYGLLLQDHPYEIDRIDEMVALMVETVCSKKPIIRLAGEDLPQVAVKSRLLKLEKDHIEYVLECLQKNKTQIRNIRQYILASLYNAPTTMGSYYAALVNYHMAQ